MKVLLLGASGLLGQNVLRQLTDEGHEVRAQVRRATTLPMQRGEVQTAVFDPLDGAMLAKAAKGQEAIVNCIGATDMSMLGIDDYLPANRDLPRLIVQTMVQLGIQTMVHTSTANTIGYGRAEKPATEAAEMEQPFADSLYARSKAMGEAVVVDAARRHADWHVVVVNPGFMIGAYDAKPSSGRMLLAAYKKRIMAAPPGGKAFVAVDDVAQAVAHALLRGKNGERYLVSGENMSIGELFALQQKTMGYAQTTMTIPSWLMVAAGWVGDGMRKMGIKTELSTNNIRQLSVREYYDDSRARTELMIDKKPLAEAIKDFHRWREQQKD